MLAAAIVPSIDTLTFVIQPAINAVALPVQATVYVITFTVKAAIDSITLPVQALRQPILIGIRGAVRRAIKPRINSITFFVQAIVNAIAFVIETIFDTVSSPVQTILNAISLIGKNTRAEKHDTDQKQRDDCHVPNFPVFHIRTPCIHMIWPSLTVTTHLVGDG
jgi:hypothetical protein